MCPRIQEVGWFHFWTFRFLIKIVLVFRKDTFSGQGTSYLSYCYSLFKINAFKTLIFRAYHIISDYLNLHTEFNFLVDFFSNNGFPKFLVTSNIRKFLDCIFQNNVADTTKNENSQYIALPFFGPLSDKLKKDILLLLSKYLPTTLFNII